MGDPKGCGNRIKGKKQIGCTNGNHDKEQWSCDLSSIALGEHRSAVEVFSERDTAAHDPDKPGIHRIRILIAMAGQLHASPDQDGAEDHKRECESREGGRAYGNKDRA